MKYVAFEKALDEYGEALLDLQDPVNDADDIIAIEAAGKAARGRVLNAFRDQQKRIEELEAEVDLFHECYQRARKIWREGFPERAEHFDPDGAEAIAEMIADHDIWEKHGLSELVKRIVELEAMLGVLRYELERLPEDALGVGGDGATHWWVRDALIEQINELLDANQKRK